MAVADCRITGESSPAARRAIHSRADTRGTVHTGESRYACSGGGSRQPEARGPVGDARKDVDAIGEVDGETGGGRAMKDASTSAQATVAAAALRCSAAPFDDMLVQKAAPPKRESQKKERKRKEAGNY